MLTDLSLAAQRELDYKVRFLRLALWLVVLTAGLLGIYRLVVTPLMSMVNMLIVVVSLFCLFLLQRRPEQIERIANLTLGAVFLGASLVYLFLHDNTVRIGVFFPFVAGAFYLQGARIGLRWLLAVVAMILAGHLLPWFPDAYSTFEITAACLYLSILFAVLYNFEKVRSEHLEQEKQLENIAHFDVLTGVPNRMLLADRLAQALARTKRGWRSPARRGRAVPSRCCFRPNASSDPA